MQNSGANSAAPHDSELTTQTTTSLDQPTMSNPISRSHNQLILGNDGSSSSSSLIAETQTMGNKQRNDCAL
jgi:hypothetical protein